MTRAEREQRTPPARATALDRWAADPFFVRPWVGDAGEPHGAVPRHHTESSAQTRQCAGSRRALSPATPSPGRTLRGPACRASRCETRGTPAGAAQAPRPGWATAPTPAMMQRQRGECDCALQRHMPAEQDRAGRAGRQRTSMARATVQPVARIAAEPAARFHACCGEGHQQR